MHVVLHHKWMTSLVYWSIEKIFLLFRCFCRSKGEVMLIVIVHSASDDGMADENPVGGGSDPTKSK